MSIDQIDNPWGAFGGSGTGVGVNQHAWQNPGMDYGWDHVENPPWRGNDYFQPKTKDQIRKEALLQLAVLAVAVVAPAVIGAGTGTAFGGTSGQAAGGAITQGTASTGASAAATSLGVSPAAGASVYAAMQPFLDPQNVQVMQAAAGLGSDALLNLLDKQGPPRGDFVYNPNSEPDPVADFPFDMDGNAGSKASREPVRLLNAVTEKLAKMPLVRRLAERMSKEKPEVGGSQILDAVSRNVSLRNMLGQQVVEVAKDLGVGNPWEGSGSTPSISEFEDRIDQNPAIVIRGGVGIQTNPRNATITGTVYLQFDTDLMLGANPVATRNNLAQQAANSINGTLNSNTYNGMQIQSNVAVIPVPPGFRPPAGAHVFWVGNGRSDPMNQGISNAQKGGKKGYLYQPTVGGDAGHEFLHWMGLSDRYTELLYWDTPPRQGLYISQPAGTGANTFYTNVYLPRGTTRLTIPIADVQPVNEPGGIYQPTNNEMSIAGASTLTPFQLQIVFNGGREKEYDKDLILVQRGYNNDEQEFRSGAVKFTGHNAEWWDINRGQTIPKTPTLNGPRTIWRPIIGVYLGQNFESIDFLVNDSKGNHGSDIRNNRQIVNDALKRLK